jgi:hypothetical protein
MVNALCAAGWLSPPSTAGMSSELFGISIRSVVEIFPRIGRIWLFICTACMLHAFVKILVFVRNHIYEEIVWRIYESCYYWTTRRTWMPSLARLQPKKNTNELDTSSVCHLLVHGARISHEGIPCSKNFQCKYE